MDLNEDDPPENTGVWASGGQASAIFFALPVNATLLRKYAWNEEQALSMIQCKFQRCRPSFRLE